jgi:hypothetical protein
MRPIISAPLIVLLLLGACAEPQHLLSEAPAAVVEPASLNGVARRPVALHIGNGFSADQESKIIAAVGDLNRNGTIRFDVARRTYSAAEPGAWTIMKPDPAVYTSDEWRVEPALTRRFSSGGGSIVVNVDGLGARDLRGIIVRELGAASRGDDVALSSRVARAER